MSTSIVKTLYFVHEKQETVATLKGELTPAVTKYMNSLGYQNVTYKVFQHHRKQIRMKNAKKVRAS